MSKAELISADEHLASCEECREMLANREDLRAQVNSLRADLEKSVASEHVEYEQLEAYIEGALGAAEREALDSHYKSCALCSAELRDLQAFKNQLREQKTLRSKATAVSNVGFHERRLLNVLLLGLRAVGRPGNRWALGACALIALAIGIRVAREWPHKSNIVHGPERIPAPIPPIIKNPPETLLARFSYLPPELQAVVADAINNQHIRTPRGLNDLAVRRGDVAGLRNDLPGLRESVTVTVSLPLLAPVGAVVYSTTPVFRWRVVSNANGYRVRVSDSRQNPVESSPVVTGTSWKSAVALRRGATYVWRVFIIVGGAEVEEDVQGGIISPALANSQARFRVLDEAHLRQLKGVHPEDHFARGILLAHAGVLVEAAQEFRAVAPSDPNHLFATRFEREAQKILVRQQVFVYNP